ILHVLKLCASGGIPLLAPGLLLEELFVLGRLILWLAALLVLLTAAAVAGIIAPGFGHSGQRLGTKGLCPCTQLCRQRLPSMICCLPAIGTSPIRSGRGDA